MFPWFRRGKARARWDPSVPILRMSAGDVVSLGDLYSGVQIWGSTGSGKTSGSMRAICRALFRAGAGAVCLCAKREDCGLYQRYARESGRADDVLIFGPEHSALRYNFVEAELARDGTGGTESRGPGLVSNLTALLMTLSEIGSRGSGGASSEGESYFRRAAEQLSRNALQSLVLAARVGGADGNTPRLTIPDMQRFVTSMPVSIEEVALPSWRDRSFCFQMLRAAERAPKSESERLDLELAISYVLGEWAGLADRTRSSILSTLTSTLDQLSRGTCRDLLSSGATNVSPQQCWDGAILIVDLPVLVYHDIARLVAIILKFCWQRASMRRDLSKGDRPMAIIADESHLFCAAPDWEFQAVARGSNTATVYATQSLSNYLEVLGKHSEAKVHALLGNLQTQCFHQLSDVRTIRYAQDLIGTRPTLLFSGNTSGAGNDLSAILGASDASTSAGFSEQELPELRAHHLNSLRKGGPANRFVVDALLYQGGRTFYATGRTWRPVSFLQK